MKKILIFAITLSILSGCHESYEERAAREAKEYTEKYCPTPIVNNTRLDSLTYKKDTRTLEYYYTLFNEADNQSAVDKSRDNLHKMLLDGIRKSTKLKVYKENGFSFKYIYHSEKSPDKVLFETVFTSKDY